MSDPAPPKATAKAKARERHAAADGDTSDARNARILRWLIRATSLAALSAEAAAIGRAARNRAVLKVLEFLFWILVAGFAFGALVTWLASVVGGLYACAIVAGGAAVIALTLHLIGRWMSRHRPSLHLADAFPGLAHALKHSPLEGSALGALALAALAGLLLRTRSKSH